MTISADYNLWINAGFTEAISGLCKSLYDHLAPLYGYGTTSVLEPIALEPAEVDKGRVSRLYAYHFFGPALVASLGREKLHQLPAWSVTDLRDGGVMVRMDEDPFGKWGGREANKMTYESAMQMLNLQKFRMAD